MSSSRPLVAVLLGGPSSEHEISLLTGALILERLDRDRFEAAPVFIDRECVWHFAPRPHPPGQSWRDALSGATAWSPAQRPDTPANPMPWRPEVCFLGLHGVYGEDGQVQRILDGLRIRYTGSGPEASARAMNKIVAKGVFRASGLPVARELELPASVSAARGATLVRAAIPGPCVVKPRDGGSSVGVEIVADPKELDAALGRALGRGEPLLVEEYVAGRELTCGVLEEPRTGQPAALPVTEIVPKGHAFFDYRAKYTVGQSDEITPAPIPELTRDRVQAIALAAHRALGCRAYSRSDLILKNGEEPILLETNTLPGLTATSLLPQEAAAVGIDFPSLLTRLVELALR
ncbi:MAG: D-alanine--D-alanine ligase family protein [Deltaproteobacteria bacterium]